MGCPFLLQGTFLTLGVNPRLLRFLHWQEGSFSLPRPGILRVGDGLLCGKSSLMHLRPGDCPLGRSSCQPPVTGSQTLGALSNWRRSARQLKPGLAPGVGSQESGSVRPLWLPSTWGQLPPGPVDTGEDLPDKEGLG